VGRWHGYPAIACAAVLGAVLCVLGPTPAAASGHTDRRFTEATANLYVGNGADDWRHDARAVLARADLVRIQEAYPRGRAVLAAIARARPAWRITHTPGEVPIMWDRREFRQVGYAHTRLANPPGRWRARYLTWISLRHRGTGRIVTAANVHPDPGYCATGAAWAPLVARHWATVGRWIGTHAARHPDRVVLLGGDFNCSLAVRWRPYFPAVVLARFRFDRLAGIDHMTTGPGRGRPRQLRRWSLSIRSDHAAQFRVLSWP
jgi:hypothetical protein